MAAQVAGGDVVTPLAFAAVGLFLAFSALVVLLFAPTAEQREARARNRDPRYFQAHPRARR